MTGAHHYREAERLITNTVAKDATEAALILSKAQVHATLALASATALGHLRSPRTADEWRTTALGESTD